MGSLACYYQLSSSSICMPKLGLNHSTSPSHVFKMQKNTDAVLQLPGLHEETKPNQQVHGQVQVTYIFSPSALSYC